MLVRSVRVSTLQRSQFEASAIFVSRGIDVSIEPRARSRLTEPAAKLNVSRLLSQHAGLIGQVSTVFIFALPYATLLWNAALPPPLPPRSADCRPSGHWTRALPPARMVRRVWRTIVVLSLAYRGCQRTAHERVETCDSRIAANCRNVRCTIKLY